MTSGLIQKNFVEESKRAAEVIEADSGISLFFMISVVTCFILWSNSFICIFLKKCMFYVCPRPQDPVRGKPGG